MPRYQRQTQQSLEDCSIDKKTLSKRHKGAERGMKKIEKRKEQKKREEPDCKKP